MIDYEWCALTTKAPSLELSEDNAIDRTAGCTVSDLKWAITWVNKAIERGGYGCVVLVRSDWDGGFLKERVEADFRLGEEAPAGLHWEDYPNWKVPKRFVAQWNRHGARKEVTS